MACIAAQVDRRYRRKCATMAVPFAVLLGLASPTGAAERTWVFSGAELKNAIEGKEAPEVSDPQMRRIVSVSRADSYIAGVADLTPPDTWCGAGTVAPHEVKDRVYAYLGDLPNEKLDGNAADLVREALARSFPCQTNKN